MNIKKIKIENIKGFGSKNNEIEVNVKPNKYNILVASNGFGKSSITAAFANLKKNRLDVPKENMHELNENAKPKIEIELDDGRKLVADTSHNEISSIFKVYVINNPLNLRATAPRRGAFVNAHAELVIPTTIIDTNVPRHVDLKYSYKTMQNKLSKNRGLMPNITEMLANNKLYKSLQTVFREFDKFEKVDCRKDLLVQQIITEIENCNGKTLADIKASFQSDNLEKLNTDGYANIVHAISPYLKCCYKNNIQVFLVFYQLLLLYRKDKANFKAKCTQAEYELFKSNFNTNLNSIDTTGRKLKAVENKGNLVLKFPKANTLSNGQRDLLSLYAKLYYLKSILHKDKNYLIIIDEVFDYLDDANFLAAQYYLSEIVNTKNVNVYVVLMTHLSPRYFHSNIFSGKKLNVQFLDKRISIDGSPLVKLIELRNKLKEEKNNKLDDEISAYLLHYNVIDKDIKEEVSGCGLPDNCLQLFTSSSIRDYAYKQLELYKRNDPYDSIGVALALRIKIEKLIYEKIRNDDDKSVFIRTHTTKKKLDYVENVLNIDIPDAYRLLSPIYNHMHFTSDYYRIVSALLNRVVQKLINDIF